MRVARNNRKYLFLISILILTSFVIIAFFISGRLDRSVSVISGSLTQKVYQQKEAFYRGEFSQTSKVLFSGRGLLAEAKTGKQAEMLMPGLRTIAFSDPKLNRVWYSIISASDTSFQVFQRDSNYFASISQTNYIRSWANSRLVNNDLPDTAIVSGLIKTTGALHWLNGTRLRLADGSVVLLGFDMDLKELQTYFGEADPVGQSYAFITDQSGFCIFHPDEHMIGRRIIPGKRFPVVLNALKKNASLLDSINSSFLGVPVVRYYSFLSPVSEQWILVVDTPTLIFDEDVTAIKNYTLVIGICSVLLIISIVVLAQRSWEKQFLLRQQAEGLQKELLLEKQQLEIISEKQLKENALLHLGKLKEKINPHFLFNSLFSLNGLIGYEPERAKEFVVKLSKVYRYVLNEYPDSLSTVEEEIRFAEQYSFLLGIRFGEALQALKLDLQPMPAGKIPFMSIQSAIENAIKHNVLSKSSPLTIAIAIEGDCLVVSNNLQPRKENKESSGQGLAYIKSIYKHYGNEGFRHGIEGEMYKCYLPLIL